MKLEEFQLKVDIKPDNNENIDNFLNKAYVSLKDLKSFPEFMENVISVTEVPAENLSCYHNWDIMVDDAQFQWKQRTVNNQEKRTVDFEMVEGDFEFLKGTWKVVDEAGKYSLQFNMNYAIGLPIIEDVLGPVLRKKLETNIYTMLSTIKNRLEVGS